MTNHRLLLVLGIPLLGALLIAGVRLGDRSGTFYGNAESLRRRFVDARFSTREPGVSVCGFPQYSPVPVGAHSCASESGIVSGTVQR